LKGHNGLRSVKQHLGTNDFRRCALGIGRPPHPGFAVNKWVLSAFDEADLADMRRAFDEVVREIWRI
jgi:PTH1 family peptidyl-tRNA hydrolase